MQIDGHFFADHFRYSKWATAKLMEAAGQLTEEQLSRDLGNSFGGVLGTLTHIYFGDRAWLARFEGAPRAAFSDPGESYTLRELEAVWMPVLDRLIAVAAQLQIEQPLAWRSAVINLSAELPLWQTLLHVVNHATYHRGQVITMMRQLGARPVSTDLVFYYIEKQAAAAAP